MLITVCTYMYTKADEKEDTKTSTFSRFFWRKREGKLVLTTHQLADTLGISIRIIIIIHVILYDYANHSDALCMHTHAHTHTHTHTHTCIHNTQ